MLTEPARVPLLHEVVVELARDEEDALGAGRIDDWIAQHGLERRLLFSELGK